MHTNASVLCMSVFCVCSRVLLLTSIVWALTSNRNFSKLTKSVEFIFLVIGHFSLKAIAFLIKNFNFGRTLSIFTVNC